MMAKASDRLHLQVLLRPDRRDEQGREDAATALRKLGLEVTGVGRASISARAGPDLVAAVFGVEPPRAATRGRPDALAGELPVPDVLAEYVERMSIAPKHVAMVDDTTRPSAKRGKEKP
jgi:hypothetical protein